MGTMTRAITGVLGEALGRCRCGDSDVVARHRHSVSVMAPQMQVVEIACRSCGRSVYGVNALAAVNAWMAANPKPEQVEWVAL